jgi:CoA:oxalate CoA-transferase
MKPLDGVRVLDFTRVLSGPHATRTLCDLGADVIKLEPPDGDITRFGFPRVNGLASYFVQQNAGKRNVSVDLSTNEGVDIALRLADRCDVLVENFRPGVMARLGLGYDIVAARNPGVVYASISGYGQTGPWVDRRAYAPVVGAEAGWTKAQGDVRGGSYANDPHSNADVYTSLECVTGILAALFARERTGRGDYVDVSMAQTLLYVNEHAHDHLWSGEVEPPEVRSFQPADYPVLTVANGETVIVSGHPAERGTFERYVRALGVAHLVDDARFDDVPSRLTALAELIEELQQAALRFGSAATLETACAQHGLAVGVLRSVREVCATDWALATDATVEVTDRGAGTMRVPNVPWRFAGAELRSGGTPKYRGEDNRHVLTELGYDADTIDELERRGVVSSRLPSGR